MEHNNGREFISAPFAVMGTSFTVLSATGVIEMLEKNAISQAKNNLALCILFRKVIDDFRSWSKGAEPGCVFQAPEIDLNIIRLSAFAPLATSLSVEAQKRAESEDAEPPSDRPLIFKD